MVSPLTSLSVTAYAGNDDLFGKTASDLQSDVIVGESAITGTLKYVDDYTGFSSKVEEQTGNYIVIRASVADTADATISVKVTNPVVLDSDGIAVLRIADKDSQTITVVASDGENESVTKVYELSGLTCETE